MAAPAEGVISSQCWLLTVKTLSRALPVSGAAHILHVCACLPARVLYGQERTPTCGWTKLIRVHKDVPQVGAQLHKLLRLFGSQQSRSQRQQGTGCNSPHIAILVLHAGRFG